MFSMPKIFINRAAANKNYVHKLGKFNDFFKNRYVTKKTYDIFTVYIYICLVYYVK